MKTRNLEIADDSFWIGRLWDYADTKSYCPT